VKLDDDPRWKRFNDSMTVCSCCGRSFSGVFAVVFDHPDSWPHAHYRGNGGEDVQVGDDHLSADLCQLGRTVFIRGVVPIPLKGADQAFSFGAWAAISIESFQAYLHAWGTAQELHIHPCSGKLANKLAVYQDGFPQSVNVVFGGGQARPTFLAVEGSLALDQEFGITFDELLDLYEASGTDIRPHLLG
jgi:hypothetical protein